MICVSGNEKIREDTTWARVTLLSSPGCICLKGLASEPPNSFAQIKLDAHTRVGAELVDKRPGSSWRSYQFGKYRRTQDQ
jgi:hypothetical protein